MICASPRPHRADASARETLLNGEAEKIDTWLIATQEYDAPAAKPRKVSWREGYDETYQRMYYFNMDTGESRWDKPDVPYKAYTDDNASATSSGTGRTSSIGE